MLLVYESGRTHLLGPTVITTSASKVQFSFGPIFFFLVYIAYHFEGKKRFLAHQYHNTNIHPEKEFSDLDTLLDQKFSNLF